MCEKCEIYKAKCQILESRFELLKDHSSHTLEIYKELIQKYRDLHAKLENYIDEFWCERMNTLWNVAQDMIDDLRSENDSLKNQVEEKNVTVH